MAEGSETKDIKQASDSEQIVRKRDRPPVMFSHTSVKSRGRGRPRLQTPVSNVEAGTGFIPYQLTLNTGEDVADKVLTFAKTCCQTICVLSAVGSISSVVLRKPGFPRTETVKWEGLYDILSLTGKCTFIPGEEDALEVHNCLNLSLAHGNGSVFGGSIVGPMIVASPANLILSSFKLKSMENLRRRTAESAAAIAAELTSHEETDTEAVSEKYRMVEGKKSRGTQTSGYFPATDKPSECVIPKTTDKPSESVTCTMREHVAGASAVGDYSTDLDIDLEKTPDADPEEKGGKKNSRTLTFGLLPTTDEQPDRVTPKTTDTETIDEPQKKENSETTDEPQVEFSSETTDKQPDSATTGKSPENVVASTSDTLGEETECHFNQESVDIPENLHM